MIDNGSLPVASSYPIGIEKNKKNILVAADFKDLYMCARAFTLKREANHWVGK